MNSYLEQDIEREIYRGQKTKLLIEKKSQDEKMTRIEQKQNDWLEPMKEWLKVTTNITKIVRDSNLLEKKNCRQRNLWLESASSKPHRAQQTSVFVPYHASRI